MRHDVIRSFFQGVACAYEVAPDDVFEAALAFAMADHGVSRAWLVDVLAAHCSVYGFRRAWTK